MKSINTVHLFYVLISIVRRPWEKMHTYIFIDITDYRHKNIDTIFKLYISFCLHEHNDFQWFYFFSKLN
jgi:hypothetical protein